MTTYNYPKIVRTDDNPVSELQEDYDMSDPEKSKIRLDLFPRLTGDSSAGKIT